MCATEPRRSTGGALGFCGHMGTAPHRGWPPSPGPGLVTCLIPSLMRTAVFFDRDDTLIANASVTAGGPFPGDLFDPALVELLPGAGAALRAVRQAGHALVVVTNQGAVARGRCDVADVLATNERMRELLQREGVELDAVYFCPFHPAGNTEPYNREHPWRKPQPGMLLQAADEFRLDLTKCWLVGDADRDIVAGVRAGLVRERLIILGQAPAPDAGHRAANLLEAAAIIRGGR
jgi:D-glycero-D-manno-heptose 1,7-bisphosphate phosphatase